MGKKRGNNNQHQPTVFIELISSDNVTLKISLKAVPKLGTIQTLLSSLDISPEEQCSKKEPIPVENVTADLLKKIIEWCEHHKDDTKEDDETVVMLGIQPWDEQFLKAFNLLGLHELIKATDYLDVRELMGYACKEVAKKVKGFSPEQLKAFFELSDGEEEEEEEDVEEEEVDGEEADVESEGEEEVLGVEGPLTELRIDN